MKVIGGRKEGHNLRMRNFTSREKVWLKEQDY